MTAHLFYLTLKQSKMDKKMIQQYSLEWYKEMRKLNKDTIISLVESNGKQRDSLKEQTKSLTEQLAAKDSDFFKEQERADKHRMELEHLKLELAEKEKALSDVKDITDFINDINYMRKLYSNQKYSQAERERDRLAEKLDDIMRLTLTSN